MALQVGPSVDAVLQRTFDPEGTATTRAQVRDLFSRLQQYVNAAFDSILARTTFTVLPNQQVYNLNDIAPDIIRLKAVRDPRLLRDLEPIEFKQLKQISMQWFGLSGPRLESWAMLGRQMVVIHPSRPQGDSVQILYVQQLPVLATDFDQFQLPDDQIPLLRMMVEAVLFFKSRDFASMQKLVENIQFELQTPRDGLAAERDPREGRSERDSKEGQTQ